MACGILLGFAMMGLCSYYAHKRNYPVMGEAFNWKNVFYQSRRSFIVFMCPILVIGGIIGRWMHEE